ncbi:MAG: 1-deoxy-D-xylulose-5-phosphate reductoisomerase [Dehalococcoidia bacterium]|nr:1-deoxy-D-xylulose-5-phosphate reductoisomerase [Dehalococcoidia bacterium]
MDNPIPQKLVILGSTGSVGSQTLDIVRAHPERLCVVGLGAGNNVKLLAEQISEFHPRFVYFQGDQTLAPPGDYKFTDMQEMATHSDVDIVVAASSGASGLPALLSAIKAGKIIALANKEALAMAGSIVMPLAKKHNAQIRPVDSEHCAIWQCLAGEKSIPSRIIITASGGPFRNYSQAELAEVSVEETLMHPSWKMGKKITVDCATLMNKGLEVIEAHWLFDMPFENIDVLVHTQSIIHSMVEFSDGAIKAQLGAPDMHLPIQYALSYPHRWDNHLTPPLDFSQISKLCFEQPDMTRFPCLKLAIEAGKEGGTCPAALCAADEVAVDMFLTERIKFGHIPLIVDAVLSRHCKIQNPSIDDILCTDAESRIIAKKIAQQEKLLCC